MANFYNPYMKTPDFGQGSSDIVNQLMMMMMMKRMMGGGDQQPQMPTTIPPQGGMSGQHVMGQAQPEMGQQQMDPQIMMILQALMRRQDGEQQ